MSCERCEVAPGYTVARIINGGWQLSRGHGPSAIDPAAAVDALLRLHEAGFTTFDCADIYTGVEELYGEFLRRYRRRRGDRPLDGVQIHTKCVPDLADLPRLRRRDVAAIVDRSLRRLGVERLDLVQLHWWDYAVPGYVEASHWLADLQRAGKIRLLGVTNFDLERLREIVTAGVDLSTLQLQYSLVDRRPEPAVARFCAEHGIHLLCYGSLAGGFLSARYLGAKEPVLGNRSLTKYRLVIEEAGGWTAFQGLLRSLTAVADKHGVSLSNVAVRWVLDRPRVAAAMIGARHADHLEDNLRVAALELDEDDDRTLHEALGRLCPLAGPPFALERVRGGPHQRIMKTGLNRLAGG